MHKKVLMNVETVYTANAFAIDNQVYVAAGSETTPEVFLHKFGTDETSLVADCPGGVMSFVPQQQSKGHFFSVMGLFPPFVGAEAGIFRHVKNAASWDSKKVVELPFAHRCDILQFEGKEYLFSASCSQFKENPLDWSKAGEVFVSELNEKGLAEEPKLVKKLFRNHGMLKAKMNGKDTIFVSGAEGIYYFDFEDGNFVPKQYFDHEVSEFGIIDIDGDGKKELVTIEPFHGNTLNVYKFDDNKWELKYQDELWFGHGLSCGMFNGEAIIVVGNRRGPLTLCLYKAKDIAKGVFNKEVLEEEAGPTQTQVFSDKGVDYILSANQLKKEVAIYYL